MRQEDQAAHQLYLLAEAMKAVSWLAVECRHIALSAEELGALFSVLASRAETIHRDLDAALSQKAA